jgi:hypothetical protein
MDTNEALNKLGHDADVDARLAVLIDHVELLLGGAEGLSFSAAERDSLRTSILQLLAGRWTQGRQEEDDRLGVATDDTTTGTTMDSNHLLHPSHSPEKRRRGLYVPGLGAHPH